VTEAAESIDTVESIDTAESMLSDAPARLGATKLVLIDGCSGAGKTVFAEGLSRSVGGELVHTDDLLDGWHDQFTYWNRLVRNIFEPIADGRSGGYRRYDWVQGKFVEWVAVKPAPVLIVEGVGAARAEGRKLASLSVFIDAPRSIREARSLARDGVAMQTRLARWRLREDVHFAADATSWCVDLVVRPAPS
jgi:uridine kinase